MDFILNPYSVFINLKNYFYDKKYFKQIHPQTKIISIGNLNTGGSGKTPMIRFIVEMLNKELKSKKILIVCKSYKAELKKPCAVNLNIKNAVKIFGDEACLLKQFLPNCDIWSGPCKSETVVQALSIQTYDMVLIDDGFSHRKIFRHCDVVLVDISRGVSHYQLFPLGQMREDWTSLKRSDLVVFTKTEGVSDEKKKYFYDKINPHQKNIISTEFKIDFINYDNNSNKNRQKEMQKNKKLFLITGIANPEKLKSDLENQGYQILQQKIYRDHYSFPESEQKKLLQLIDLYSELQPVVTGKDFIKITNSELKNKVIVVEVKVDMTDSDRKIFHDKILS